MGRPTTANACNVRTQVMLLATKEVRTVACPRGEGHRGDHHARFTWSPRLTPPARSTAHERKED
jgi:hypothetical protein